MKTIADGQSAPYTCQHLEQAAPGKSELGETPLRNGVESALSGLSEALDGKLSWLFTAISAVFGLILMPLHWATSAASFIADGLGYLIQALFVPCDAIAGFINVDPVLTTCVLTTLTVRIILLPVVMRGQIQTARTMAYAPLMQKIKTRFPGNRQRQAQEMQKLQSDLKFNPLGGCFPIVAVIALYAGTWRLFQGLTVRSGTGTFRPDHVSLNTDIAHYLGTARYLTGFSMNLTSTIGQVGFCSSSLPYLITILLCGAMTSVSLVQFLASRNLKSAAWIAVVATTVAASFLPPILLIVRLVDCLYMLTQTKVLHRRVGRAVLRLREDPKYLAAMGERPETFMPPEEDRRTT